MRFAFAGFIGAVSWLCCHSVLSVLRCFAWCCVLSFVCALCVNCVVVAVVFNVLEAVLFD